MNFNTASVLAPASADGSSSLVFIDLAVPDALTLIAGVAPETTVYLFSAVDNPVVQMTETLMKHHPVSSLHIVSHGRSGSLEVGNQWLSLENLHDYASHLQSWSTALTADAEILLYGCEVGKGDRGRQFVRQLSQLTGATVAASEGLTGNVALGGDWDLKVQTGKMTAELAFRQQAIADYAGVLGTYTVTNTSDSGEGSLRQAVLDANASGGDDTISFAGSTFTDATPDTIVLTTGELALNDTTTILGTGANLLTLSGNNVSRVFSINTGAIATLNDLTIANGYADNGGGIFSNGNLTLNNSILSNNRSTFYNGSTFGGGGGIYNTIGTLTLNNSTFSNNAAQANGGGFHSDAGAVTITNSTFTGNSGDAGGGFIVISGTVNVTNSTFTSNPGNYGGGFALGGDSSIVAATVNDSTFTNNSAGYGGAISGSNVTVNNSTFTGNTARQNAGGIFSRGTLEINNSTLNNNSAGIQGFGDGGGIRPHPEPCLQRS